MTYIEHGVAIGLSAAAGVGAFIVALFVILGVLAAVMTVIGALGGADIEDDDKHHE